MINRKIVLDQESFKALASDTRIEILKKLDNTQLTVTDLANAMAVNKSAVHKHLTRLVEAGLVKKKEGDRKWVYYTLSLKGAQLLHPERVQIALMLAATAVAVSFGIYQIMSYLGGYNVPFAYGTDRAAGASAASLPQAATSSFLLHNSDLLVIGAAMVAIAAVLAAAAHSTWKSAASRAA
ncbi:MAG TPA: winged helix-turn-helix domain-containing protein [Candidatus Thermoplasmatota archaeon]|nr:winged helix-turn-helix domain-containing protein [Candidatus Thermoplasmatota archaeon]